MPGMSLRWTRRFEPVRRFWSSTQQDRLLATGTAVLAPEEMMQIKRGLAVQARKGGRALIFILPIFPPFPGS